MLFAKPDRGSAQSARSRLTNAIMVDRTVAAAGTVAAEIATLRQKLAAAALEQFTSWTSDKAKGVMSRLKPSVNDGGDGGIISEGRPVHTRQTK